MCHLLRSSLIRFGLVTFLNCAAPLFAQKIYWTDDLDRTIHRCNPNGSQVEQVLRSQDITAPTLVAVDHLGGRVYWAELYRIQRADLDGQSTETVIESILPINGFAIEPSLDALYWTAGYAGFGGGIGEIHQSDLAGAHDEIVYETFEVPVGISIDAAAGKLYWSMNSGGDVVYGVGVLRSNLDGSNVESVIDMSNWYYGQIALDLPNAAIYWVQHGFFVGPDSIYRTDLSGDNQELIITGEYVSSLALDLEHDRMYWTNEVTQSLRTSDLNGDNVQSLLAQEVAYPGGVAVDVEAQRLYVSDRSTARLVRRAGVDETDVETILEGVLGQSLGLALHQDSGELFWTDFELGQLRKARLDGRNPERLLDLSVAGFGSPKGLAIDDQADRLYWVQPNTYPAARLRRSTLDGDVVETLLQTGMADPYGVALDIEAQLIYWTEPSTRKIKRVDYQGENAQTIAISAIDSPRGLEVDPAGGKVYWAEEASGDYHKVRRANLDGTNIETIVGQPNYGSPWDVAVDAAGGHVFWTDQVGPKIRRANLDGSGLMDLVTTGLSDIRGIVFEPLSGKLYWVDRFDNLIMRCNADGTQVEEVVRQNVQSPQGIALDLAGGKMYWTDSTARRVRRSNLDGTHLETLIIESSFPRGIALHASEGKMYWIGPGRIRRANLDGTNVEDVITEGLMIAQGLAIDATVGKLYWSNRGSNVGNPDGSIRRADLNGQNNEVIAAGLFDPYGIALDTDAGKVYWLDVPLVGAGRIQRANLDGSGLETLPPSANVSDGGLGLDPVAGYLYWNSGVYLKRADLNGMGETTVSSFSYGANGVAVDSAAQQLYITEYLYPFGDTGQIRRHDLINHAWTLLIAPGFNHPVDVAVHAEQGKVFWLGTSGIHRANLDGTEVETVLSGAANGGDVLSGLVISHDDGKLYWSNNSQRKIRRANLDGSNVELLVSGDPQHSTWGLAVDAQQGKMYWGSSQRLFRANLNGTEVEPLAESVLEAPRDIELDRAAQRLYWVDNYRVVGADVDGENFAVLVPSSGTARAIDLVVDTQDERFYWTDLGGPSETDGSIKRARFDGSDLETLVSGLRAPQAITLNSSPHIMSATPPDRAIDARQPHHLHDSEVGQNWAAFALQFSGDVEITTDRFDVTEIGGDGTAPQVATATPIGTDQANITLSAGIESGAWTCVNHIPSGTRVCAASLPSDVDNDQQCSAVDILRLIDNLNGIVDPPYEVWQTDIDRSNASTPADILRVIDLLNGAESFEPWLGRSLPPLP